MAYLENVEVQESAISDVKLPMLVVGIFQDKELSPAQQMLDERLDGYLNQVLETDDFRGKKEQTEVVLLPDSKPVRRLLLVGLGKRDKYQLDDARKAAGNAVKEVQSRHIPEFGIELLGRSSLQASSAEVAQAVTEGLMLGSYRFSEYKTNTDEDLYTSKKAIVISEEDVSSAVARGAMLGRASLFVRDLANHPSNVMTPTRLAEEAEQIAKSGGFKCRVYDRDEVEKMGMGAFAGVAKGAEEPPKFIVLEYHGGEKKAPPVAFVGKGITFDTGGISIKPSKKMHEMKYDMCGAGAVLGIMHAVAEIKPPINIVAAVAATENMPGGKAYKPGDILKAYSGKTIEVLNTDAEGRLALADALAFVREEFQPQFMINFATLTGAAVVALGHRASALLGNDDDLIRDILAAGDYTGERCWQLPLWEEYSTDLESDAADIQNIGEQGAGTITAGAFLKAFVGDTPWAHLDIAGTAWWSQEQPYIPKGASGVGVRVMMRWLEQLTV